MIPLSRKSSTDRNVLQGPVPGLALSRFPAAPMKKTRLDGGFSISQHRVPQFRSTWIVA